MKKQGSNNKAVPFFHQFHKGFLGGLRGKGNDLIALSISRSLTIDLIPLNSYSF